MRPLSRPSSKSWKPTMELFCVASHLCSSECASFDFLRLTLPEAVRLRGSCWSTISDVCSWLLSSVWVTSDSVCRFPDWRRIHSVIAGFPSCHPLAPYSASPSVQLFAAASPQYLAACDPNSIHRLVALCMVQDWAAVTRLGLSSSSWAVTTPWIRHRCLSVSSSWNTSGSFWVAHSLCSPAWKREVPWNGCLISLH